MAGLAVWLLGSTALAAGGMLLIGLMTPLVGVVIGLGGIGLGLSMLPACSLTMFASKAPLAFAVAIVQAVILLGPGAFSLDARLFGRRDIIIPRPPS